MKTDSRFQPNQVHPIRKSSFQTVIKLISQVSNGMLPISRRWVFVREFTWIDPNVPQRKEFQCAFAFRPSPDMVPGMEENIRHAANYQQLPEGKPMISNRTRGSQQFPRN